MNSQEEQALSVLIPVFNPGPYLDPALGSVLDQLGDGDELVIQDAGSTDGTTAALLAAAERDPRIRVVVEPDDGQSDGLNRCLARARNRWCVWLNADDLVLDGGIAALKREIAAHPAVDLVIGGHRLLRADGSTVDEFPGHLLTVEYCVVRGIAGFSGSIAMRTEFLRSVGGFRNDLNTVMDLELQLRMAAAAPRQVLVDAPVGALRLHDASKSSNLGRQFVSESHAVRQAYAKSAGLRVRAFGSTILHVVLLVTWPVRLHPAYRRVRAAIRAMK
ncbi:MULTISPECIES: glycosyltransferase [Gordonia]|uniref:glycosyltransferase n=1 Tax=Gordonia TaxID=2053 RepID=UPI001999EAA9|nr:MULTISPECIES: glycosyltransferase [Gordonia]MBD0024538.1 glycosyltransferase [Gordonia sp. (in: high G+C Gram-positive bacteria)]